jgi:hypothetical protein
MAQPEGSMEEQALAEVRQSVRQLGVPDGQDGFSSDRKPAEQITARRFGPNRITSRQIA